MTASIELVEIRKEYPNGVAVHDISLKVEAGEFFTLLGPSGSGKTTTLMAIAGFVDPEKGDILLRGQSIRNLAPEKRNLGVVFQSYALFPNMTVAQNVRFPLRMRHVNKQSAAKRVADTLRLVGLADFADRRISELSGGQQQRVALARALVFEPPVLLMDEPLGALDRKLREQLQGEIKRIQKALGVTVVYVTHDQEEALVLSDRIAVMEGGKIHQMGPAAELYERPANMFVAQFLGESNIIDGQIAKTDGGRIQIDLKAGAGSIEAVSFDQGPAAMVRVLIRPEAMSLATQRHSGCNALSGQVQSLDYLGSSIRYVVETRAGRLAVRVPRAPTNMRFEPGAELFVTWRPEDAKVFG
jgi:spermidine/putrescine ABC transporter ATP-binding subunit